MDVDARQGSKGPGKNIHGCKRHDAVDMRSSLVNRVAATSAEVTHAAGLAYVCPNGGVICADKGYCGRDEIDTLDANGCHDATFKRDNCQTTPIFAGSGDTYLRRAMKAIWRGSK